jgi:Asp-tRNA(Asn)/Glu-tRNA(Gln) amidotransferase C subunit
MTSPASDNSSVVTDETVQMLAALVGVRVEPEDRAAMATRLGELFAAVGDLDALDWEAVEPELAFDPSWGELK